MDDIIDQVFQKLATRNRLPNQETDWFSTSSSAAI